MSLLYPHAFGQTAHRCNLLSPVVPSQIQRKLTRETKWRTQAFRTKDSSEVSVSGYKTLKTIIAPMFLAGAILGPLLDGIHGTVGLLEYKVGSYDVAGLHSSFWVSPLLGSFYAIIGPLHTVLDTLANQSGFREDGANNQLSIPKLFDPVLKPLYQILSDDRNAYNSREIAKKISFPFLALNVGIVAFLLEVSALLYDNNVPYGWISVILGCLAFSSWKAFDGTKQGILLALLCGLAAPLSELVLINVFGLWQYPHPDIFGSGGVPSWVFWCYFFYTSSVGNIARYLRKLA